MKTPIALFLFFLSVTVTGCDKGPRTVTDGADKQAIADYEEALKRVTSEEIKPEP